MLSNLTLRRRRAGARDYRLRGNSGGKSVFRPARNFPRAFPTRLQGPPARVCPTRNAHQGPLLAGPGPFPPADPVAFCPAMPRKTADFSAAIAGLEAHGFSRSEIAQQVGISRMTVWRIAEGVVHQPSYSTAERLGQLYESAVGEKTPVRRWDLPRSSEPSSPRVHFSRSPEGVGAVSQKEPRHEGRRVCGAVGTT